MAVKKAKTTKTTKVKKTTSFGTPVVAGNGIPEKEPDIKISDDVVSALENGFKDLSERLDKLVEKVSHIATMYDAFASGDTSLAIWIANEYSIPITVAAFRENLEVAVYNKKGTDFDISGSISVDGNLTVDD